MYLPFLPQVRGGRGVSPAHPPQDRHPPRRHQPAVLRLTDDPHRLPAGRPDQWLTPPVAPPRATLIDLAADPRFARVRVPDPAPFAVRALIGHALMRLGLRLLRTGWPG